MSNLCSSSSPSSTEEEAPSLLRRIQELDGSQYARLYVGFVVGDICVGQVHRCLLDGVLLDCRDAQDRLCFRLATTLNDKEEEALFLVDHDKDKDDLFEERTAKMNCATQTLMDHQILTKRHGELYPIGGRHNHNNNNNNNNNKVLCVVDRNAAPYFGVTSVGVHLNCFVRTRMSDDKKDKECVPEELSLWVGKRCATKSTFPCRWDTTVAGGQPAGLSLLDNLVKEAEEEAGVSQDFVRKHATPVSCLSQMTSNPDGTCLKHSQYYCWDLEVDSDFIPHTIDGEVSQFQLWSASELKQELLVGHRLRPAMRLVIADFLVRHGILTPDDEPEYASISAAMHKDRLVLWHGTGEARKTGTQP